jgi:hypothetical protein
MDNNLEKYFIESNEVGRLVLTGNGSYKTATQLSKLIRRQLCNTNIDNNNIR